MKIAQAVKAVPPVACKIAPLKALEAAKPLAYPKTEGGGEEEPGWRFVHGHAIYVGKPPDQQG